MPLNLPKPIIYLITSGATTSASTPSSEDFQNVLALVRAATHAHIPLVQLREKNLNTRTLFELAIRSVEITRGTKTRLLINDRADIASVARADGCHLTTSSLEVSVIRRTFGSDFLIGVSTHSLAEAQAARDGGADFAVFGPVFDTLSKQVYGEPVGLDSLREAAHRLSPFPLLALGGVALENMSEISRTSASGVAAIRLFSESIDLDATVRAIRDKSSDG